MRSRTKQSSVTSDESLVFWLKHADPKRCDCMFGIGGSCKCEHDYDYHDDCSQGYIHCHAEKSESKK